MLDTTSDRDRPLVVVAQPSAGRDRAFRDAMLTLLVVFVATFVIFTVANLARGGSLGETIAVGLPMVIGDFVIAVPIFHVLRATARMPAVRRWPLVILAGAAVDFVQTVWDTLVRLGVGAIPFEQDRILTAFISSTTINTYHTGMVVALLAFQSAYLSLREHQRQLIAARESEREAHQAALRFQLNPHFLFNTMNALSGLVMLGRNVEAEGMIDRLATFLRASLVSDPGRLVRLDEEFDVIEAYLDIERLRFDKRLVVDIALPDRLGELLVPPFLLQPLVENAMKYAVAPSRRPVSVAITAEAIAGELVLTVDDDGDCEEKPGGGTGLGIDNIRQRLELSFGQAARLTAGCSPGGGYRARITVPLDRLQTTAQ